MMTDSSLKANKQMAGALARWESEGGGQTVQPAQERIDIHVVPERQILERLGAAVVVKWNDFPTNVQRAIFRYASAVEEACDPDQLKTRIARFLHDHKDDANGS